MLTDHEKAILDLERRMPRHSWQKVDAIRDELDWTPARYYQALGVLADSIEARRYAPEVVSRIDRTGSCPGA